MPNVEKQNGAARDALDNVRTAAQELHKAITNTMAQQTAATKAQIDTLVQQAKSTTEFAKAAVRTQQDASKKFMTEAIEKLEATQRDAGDILANLNASKDNFNAAVLKAATNARASVQKVSEAVAARRAQQNGGRAAKSA